MRARIVGTGLAAPKEVRTSCEVAARLGVDEDWILERTGIRERRLAGEDEATSDLAVAAGAGALAAAGLGPDRIDLLILATSTPDHLLPPTAPMVAHRLGLRVPAFDLAAACSGFLYGLALADRWLRAGGQGVLLIGANVLSRRVNWEDRNTAILFGDGAGAVALVADQGPAGVLATHLDANGALWDKILVPAGGSRQPITPECLAARQHLMQMPRGKDLFRHAVTHMAAAARTALAAADLSPAEVDWFIPHQAGIRLMGQVGRELGIPPERTVVNVDRYGNTSAASIPMALHEAVADGRIQRGHRLLLAAVGGGLTAGAAVIQW
ncbi:MAG TPA: beta-ketoacyl-ACP synthase III [Symbiobacteriaceae bacterium]